MIIVTGGAGMIGSNIVAALNAEGRDDVLVVDDLTDGRKIANLADLSIADYLDKDEFLPRMEAREFGDVDAVFHQGACSTTTEWNGKFMMEVNYAWSKRLLHACLGARIPFLYASSASVYGGGSIFREERQFEAPLNVYAYSKFLFDQIVRRRLPEMSSQVVGLRYFNVYGPGEQHKGRMASVAHHFFKQFQSAGKVKLFEGSGGYAEGEQRRDFVWIADVVKVNLFFLDHPDFSGIFNLGSGHAQSFNDVAVATVNACRAAKGEAALSLADMLETGIVEYIAFPPALQGKYQSYTQADLGNLRRSGYDGAFSTVEQGVADYVAHLLGSGQAE